MALALIVDLLRLLRLTFRSRARLAAENLFLRKQLACYVERKVRPKGADNASRVLRNYWVQPRWVESATG
jgi:signal transduction histidine kinase